MLHNIKQQLIDMTDTLFDAADFLEDALPDDADVMKAVVVECLKAMQESFEKDGMQAPRAGEILLAQMDEALFDSSRARALIEEYRMEIEAVNEKFEISMLPAETAPDWDAMTFTECLREFLDL